MRCVLRLLPFLPCLILLTLVPAQAAAPPRGKAKVARKANRLARESSPYLLQHAHNPVDWYPWGPEAFARAKKEGKLIFLSIGYSSCHWCHVMEKESFAHEAVARILNQHFICIKVDREERPDIDTVYMAALAQMRIPGGWPLSMWLLPDGRPVVGGTYWPREDRTIEGEKDPGFKTLLVMVAQLYKDEPKKVLALAERWEKATRASLSAVGRGPALVELDGKLVEGTLEEVGEMFDPVHGGFGSPARMFRGPKFPIAARLWLMEHEARRRGATGPGKAPPARAKEWADRVDLMLDRMARGGIYDHLGGGFHRYTVERTWTVPHFEKMLYDQGQLLEVYALAYQRTRKPLHARVLRQTVDFLARDMTNPQGGFYSAFDADSEGEEGRYYVWTPAELTAALPDRAERSLFFRAYGIDDGVNFEGKYHILRLPRPLADLAKARKTSEEALEAELARIRAKLLAIRAKRESPFLDRKVLTAWNGHAIAGLALTGKVLGDKKALAMAERSADFVLRNLRNKDGRLLRSWGAAPGEKAKARANAYLDDYAYLIHGLLNLHDATGQKRWLDEAKALADAMVRWHHDNDRGAFFYTSHDHEKLFARAKDQYDGAQPAANSVAAQDLVRLWAKTGEKRYRDLAERTFRALAGPLKLEPGTLPYLAEALARYLEEKARRKG